jgi:hypothetical protein
LSNSITLEKETLIELNAWSKNQSTNIIWPIRLGSMSWRRRMLGWRRQRTQSGNNGSDNADLFYLDLRKSFSSCWMRSKLNIRSMPLN